MKTLVIGLGGTGKSTWVKNHLKDGLCFDLDALAFALRLDPPDTEKTKRSAAAMACAGEFLASFLDFSSYCSRDFFVIRTAPPLHEIEEIEPDRIVVGQKVYVARRYGGEEAAAQRIRNAISWAQERFIPVEYFP